MGLSGFKVMLVVGVVLLLFLPTLVKRSQGLPEAIATLRARLTGEPLPEPTVAFVAPAVPVRLSLAERVGRLIGAAWRVVRGTVRVVTYGFRR
jgi:hypothetical protein